MKKCSQTRCTGIWAVAAGIVLLNLILILCGWKSHPAELPLHISPDGSYTATMPYTRLLLYPCVSLAASVLIFAAGASAFRLCPRYDDARGTRRMLYALAACCMDLIVLCSTCVGLTMGQTPFFMYAEPVLLLLLIICITAAEIRIRKKV